MRVSLFTSSMAVGFWVAIGCQSNDTSDGSFDPQRMAGVWEFHHDGTHEMAEWQVDDEGNLRGRGFILFESDTIFIEFLHITKTDKGLVYSVSSSPNKGGEEVLFKAQKTSQNSIEFFNSSYPFPQRIVYTLSDDSTMLNYIEGVQEGEVVRKNFVYRKLK